jgi:abhydrolase domain-containing protein 8
MGYDFYGCGHSPKPLDWSAYGSDELFQDLVDVWGQLVERTPSSHIFVVGHSYGTHFAMRLAAHVSDHPRHSHRLRGLVLLGAPRRPIMGGHPVMRLPVFVLNWMQPYLSSTFRSLAFDDASDPELVREQETHSNENPMHMCKAYYCQVSGASDDTIRSLELPCLLIHGESDGITPLVDAQELHRMLPNAGGQVYTIPRTSHCLMLERPDQVIELLRSFIAMHTDTAATPREDSTSEPSDGATTNAAL